MWLKSYPLTPINLENLQSKLTTNVTFNLLFGKNNYVPMWLRKEILTSKNKL